MIEKKSLLTSAFAQGMTLIELLVALSILGTLLGLAIPAYNVFNNNQKVTQSREQVVTFLRDAQNRATSNEDAGRCASGTTFDGWYVVITQGAGSITLAASCTNSSGVTQTIAGTTKTQTFVDTTIRSVDSGTPTYVVFRPLTQNVQFFSGPNFATPLSNTAVNVSVGLSSSMQDTVTINNIGRITTSD